MERIHLKDGGSIGITTIDGDDGTQTRLNVIGATGPATVTLTPEEEEDLVHLIATGSKRPRCRECGCVQERACVRVDGDRIVETCGWAEGGPDPLCTACVPEAGLERIAAGAEDVKGAWKHPAEQEAEFEAAMRNE